MMMKIPWLRRQARAEPRVSTSGTRCRHPVFFNGAEEFSYNLKNLKRATIIGETTGGAHPVSGHRIDDHFMIGVPFARAVNPVSKTHWEGTGVQPDVPAKASEALEVAEKMAASKIQAK